MFITQKTLVWLSYQTPYSQCAKGMVEVDLILYAVYRLIPFGHRNLYVHEEEHISNQEINVWLERIYLKCLSP